MQILKKKLKKVQLSIPIGGTREEVCFFTVLSNFAYTNYIHQNSIYIYPHYKCIRPFFSKTP